MTVVEGEDSAVWVTVTADYAIGSSGGPVLNDAGEVVGMVSRTSTVSTADDAASGQPAAGNVQMVFKDCVSLATMRGLFKP